LDESCYYSDNQSVWAFSRCVENDSQVKFTPSGTHAPDTRDHHVRISVSEDDDGDRRHDFQMQLHTVIIITANNFCTTRNEESRRLIQ
jgi:hypothetical protein